jgi:hypothetical protein
MHACDQANAAHQPHSALKCWRIRANAVLRKLFRFQKQMIVGFESSYLLARFNSSELATRVIDRTVKFSSYFFY